MSFYEVASELENFHTLKWLGYLERLNHSDLIWGGKPCQIVGLISKNMTNATFKRVWLHCVAWICWTNEKKSNLQMNVHSNLFYFIYTWWVHTCSSLGLYSTLICITYLMARQVFQAWNWTVFIELLKNHQEFWNKTKIYLKVLIWFYMQHYHGIVCSLETKRIRL